MSDNKIVAPDGGPAHELPPHLREGLEIFNEWAAARAASGNPLPPGGAFILTKVTVLTDAILRMRRRLAVSLQMPLGCVTTDIEHDKATGRIVPRIDVKAPDEWLTTWQAPGTKGDAPSGRVEEFAREYIQGRIRDASSAFKDEVARRLAALSQTRPDLMPTVTEDLLEPDADPGS